MRGGATPHRLTAAHSIFGCVRTTVNLPGAVAEAARRCAVEEGRTLSTSVVEEGLRAATGARPAVPQASALRAYGDPAGRFLVDPTDRGALWEALDADGVG